MSEAKPLVLYHAGCFDGFCAAWICNTAMPGVECIPVQYGQEPPDVTGRDVYIVDFSYKRDVLLSMADRAKRIIVLDHHETAKDELADINRQKINLFVKLDMKKSGGRLTWDEFFPDKRSPWLVDYTEDRDLWRHALPDSKAVNAFIRSWPREFASWNVWSVYEYIPDGFIAQGNAILRAEQAYVKSALGSAREIELDGHKVLAVNSSIIISEIGGELAKDRPFGVVWFVRGDGKTQWSLRSREGGINVAEIAKKFGGGGHRDAAGFETSEFIAAKICFLE